MIATLAGYWVQLTSMLLTVMLSVGSVFGAYAPATTKSAAEYYDDGIKNVIFLIGDGMGYNHLEKTKLERNEALKMDLIDYQGSSMSRSLTAAVTDSAAGGTALATGERTFNGGIGVYFTDSTAALSYPKNLTELFAESGKMTGVITSDKTSGATPAAFSAHSSDRDNTEDITADQMASDIDLIWGEANGVATKAEAEKYGFNYVTTYNEMMALEEGGRSFAQFSNTLWNLEQSDENTPTLSQMAEKAIDLLDDTDEGFFIMIEGAHIDKHSHSNDSEAMTEALLEFDKTVEYALDYAEKDGETLVIVTADHETGAITLKDGAYCFTSGSHSAADVPLRIYGSDKIIADGETINNYEVPIRVAYALGFTEDEFPCEVAA